jgi:hypothetical protein
MLETRICQMVCFQTKNPNLGKFWRALDWTILIYFTAIWNILGPFGTFLPVLVKRVTKNLATLLEAVDLNLATLLEAVDFKRR